MKKIFVIGAPRTGTKIVCEMLGSDLNSHAVVEMPNWRFLLDLFAAKKYVAIKPTYEDIRNSDLYSEFPDAKFIFLVRDPKDSYASYKNFYKNHRLLLSKFLIPPRFDLQLQDYYEWIQQYKSKANCFFLQFKDLILNKHQAIRKIFEFLGFPTPASIIRWAERWIKNRPVDGYLQKAESVSKGLKIGNYKKVLTPDEIKLFNWYK